MALWGFLELKIIFFFKYWSPSSIMVVNDGSKLWHIAHLKKFALLIEFWSNKIK